MDELGYYRCHSRVTAPGAKQHLLSGLPGDVAAMARVIGGVLVHRDQTRRFGFALPQQRREEAHTRYVEAILGYLGTLDERRPEDRFAGVCRDFTILLCAMLREAGVPARARAGFAGYFSDGFFDDHWVVEVWDDDRGWYLVDAQIASAPKNTYTDADVDPLDVPRDAFLVAGQAWQECQSGRRDLARIGTNAAGLTGMWEVQGNVVRDLASLNRVETLPWDDWGLIPTHYDQLDPTDLDLLDRVATGQRRRRTPATGNRDVPRRPAPASAGRPRGLERPAGTLTLAVADRPPAPVEGRSGQNPYRNHKDMTRSSGRWRRVPHRTSKLSHSYGVASGGRGWAGGG
jgi:hypothetical protein